MGGGGVGPPLFLVLVFKRKSKKRGGGIFFRGISLDKIFKNFPAPMRGNNIGPAVREILRHRQSKTHKHKSIK